MQLLTGAAAILSAPDPYAAFAAELSALVAPQDLAAMEICQLGVIGRLIDESLWITITGSSGSGKSHLRRQVLEGTPEEDRLVASAMSDQALIRMATSDGEPLNLRHKAMFFDERAPRARDPDYMRSLYEDGFAIKRVPRGGNTSVYSLEGRPSLVETTTAGSIFPEDQSRRIMLAMDESPPKHRAVLERIADEERRTTRDELERVCERLRALQRALPRGARIEVPFSRAVLSPSVEGPLDGRVARWFRQLLGLTRTVTLIRHQQRREGDRFVAQNADYEVAYRLLVPIQERAVTNLPQQDLEGIQLIGAGAANMPMGEHGFTFTRQDVNAWTGRKRQTAARLIERLIEEELLLTVSEGSKGKNYRYRLAAGWQAALTGQTPFADPRRVAEAARAEAGHAGMAV